MWFDILVLYRLLDHLMRLVIILYLWIHLAEDLKVEQDDDDPEERKSVEDASSSVEFAMLSGICSYFNGSLDRTFAAYSSSLMTLPILSSLFSTNEFF